ncbi:MAG: hypothetical protein ACRDAG_05270 [Cetobacterium somerae]|uniref:hypothetical protein n=1 Tax=Cetobacterium somerae TaxID=188913 RepID=UPI003F37628C
MLLTILQSGFDIVEIKNLKNKLATSKTALKNLELILLENNQNLKKLNRKVDEIIFGNIFLSNQLIELKGKEKNLKYDENQIFEDIKYFVDILIAKEREIRISKAIKNISDEKNQIIKQINYTLITLNQSSNSKNSNYDSSSKSSNDGFSFDDNHDFIRIPFSFGLLSTIIKFLKNKLKDINIQVEQLNLNLKNIKNELILINQQIETEEVTFKSLCQEKLNLDNDLKISMASIEFYKVLFSYLECKSLNELKLHLDKIFKLNPILNSNFKLKNLYLDICKEIN